MNRLQRYVGDFSGAFADLGASLPIVLGVLALQQIDPSGRFIGFGLFALATALFYRRPVPVQPMKVVAAVGALLVFAGFQMVLSKRLLRVERWELAVALTTGLCCLLFNVAVGLLAGLAAEWLRRRILQQPREAH